MKKRLKIIFYFLLELVLSLLVLGSVGLIFLKNTVYSPDYVKKQLEESNYYTHLSQTIYDRMSENVYQAALDETILENLYTVDSLKTTVNEMIDTVYAGKEYKVDTTHLKEVLENNINAYLEKHSMEVTNQESLNELTNLFANIYTREITISNATNLIYKLMNKTASLINIGIIVCIILAIILSIIIKIKFKDITYAIPFILTGAMFIIINMYINHSIVVQSIYLGDPKLTSLVQQVLTNILGLCTKYGIITIVIGSLAAAIEYIVSSLKPKEKKEPKIAKKTVNE